MADQGSKQASIFDAEDWMPLSEAYEYVRTLHPTATPLTVRKFLVAISFCQSQSLIGVYAETYRESAVRIDRDDAPLLRRICEQGESIPVDFWRLGMAMEPLADGSFKASNLASSTQLTVAELPYRMRDKGGGEIQSEQVELLQMAEGVHFQRDGLIALAVDPSWQRWWDLAYQIAGNRGARGRPASWSWDRVKVELTIEAARNPEILNFGPAPIVAYMTETMRQLHDDQIPDHKTFYEYANLFLGLWNAARDGPCEPDCGPPN